MANERRLRLQCDGASVWVEDGVGEGVCGFDQRWNPKTRAQQGDEEPDGDDDDEK